MAWAEHINSWSGVGAGLAWAVVWQSALLIAGATLIAALLRGASPRLRYWLWQIVVLKVLLMPFWTMAVPMPSWPLGRATPEVSPSSAAAAVAPSAIPTEVAAVGAPEKLPQMASPAADTPLRTTGRLSWQSWLALGWLLIVAIQGGVLVWQHGRLRRLLQAAVPASESLARLVQELAGQLGLRRVPAVVLTTATGSPFVCGLARPVLVMPQRLLSTLDGERLRQVVLHELAHIERHDLAWGWPVEISRRLLFFDPLIHWLAYRVRLERELACDQVAMAASGRCPGEYVETLVHVVAQASQPPVLQTAALTAGLDGNGANCRTSQERLTGAGDIP